MKESMYVLLACNYFKIHVKGGNKYLFIYFKEIGSKEYICAPFTMMPHICSYIYTRVQNVAWGKPQHNMLDPTLQTPSNGSFLPSLPAAPSAVSEDWGTLVQQENATTMAEGKFPKSQMHPCTSRSILRSWESKLALLSAIKKDIVRHYTAIAITYCIPGQPTRIFITGKSVIILAIESFSSICIITVSFLWWPLFFSLTPKRQLKSSGFFLIWKVRWQIKMCDV